LAHSTAIKHNKISLFPVNQPRITKYSDGRELPYGGKFFNFVASFRKDIGNEKENIELGKAIEKSLEGIPKTPPNNS
jgi:hypothetical protein